MAVVAAEAAVSLPRAIVREGDAVQIFQETSRRYGTRCADTEAGMTNLSEKIVMPGQSVTLTFRPTT